MSSYLRIILYEKINTDSQLVRAPSSARHFKIYLQKYDWEKYCIPNFNETNDIPYSEQYVYGFDYGIKEKINELINVPIIEQPHVGEGFKNTELSLIHHHHINLVSCDATLKNQYVFLAMPWYPNFYGRQRRW